MARTNSTSLQQLKAIMIATAFGLFGCGGEADEAKKLGFSSVEEMKEAHAKGWHTQQQYHKDNPDLARKTEAKRITETQIAKADEAKLIAKDRATKAAPAAVSTDVKRSNHMDLGICYGATHYGVVTRKIPFNKFSDNPKTTVTKYEPYWEGIKAKLLQCTGGSVEQQIVNSCKEKLSREDGEFYKGFALGAGYVAKEALPESIILNADLLCINIK